MDPLLKHSALTLARLYAAGEISPVEMTSVALAHQEQTDRVLNTSYLQTPDLALELAAASEKRWWAGRPLSALDGIPTTIKDGLAWAGHAMYRGYAGFGSRPMLPTYDAPVTRRMLEAGMVMLGKTTMPDLGILASGYSSHHGVTRNPHNPMRTPGGSSSGTAAAIAAGSYPVAVGTDIVGSIRLPAAFCGLFGLKPSQGRVPYYPPASPALVAGPMSRTVEDAAALLDIIAQPDGRDFTALPPAPANYVDQLKTLNGPRTLGLVLDFNLGVDADDEVLGAVEAAAHALEQLGHRIVPLQSTLEPSDLAAGEQWYRHRARHEMQSHAQAIDADSPYLREWTASCQSASAEALFGAWRTLWDVRARLADLMSQVDYLLCPTVPYPPFAATLPAPSTERLFEPWVNTFIFNLSEMPAASINCGYTEQRLPIGLQIVGQRYDDLGVLQLSQAFASISEAAETLPVAVA